MKKGLKGCGLLLVSMESIAEVVIVSVKRQCTSCNVFRGEDQFARCAAKCSIYKTCQNCRDSKKRYRNKLRASRTRLIDDSMSVSSSSSSSSTTQHPPFYFGPVLPKGKVIVVR